MTPGADEALLLAELLADIDRGIDNAAAIAAQGRSYAEMVAAAGNSDAGELARLMDRSRRELRVILADLRRVRERLAPCVAAAERELPG